MSELQAVSTTFSMLLSVCPLGWVSHYMALTLFTALGERAKLVIPSRACPLGWISHYMALTLFGERAKLVIPSRAYPLGWVSHYMALTLFIALRERAKLVIPVLCKHSISPIVIVCLYMYTVRAGR